MPVRSPTDIERTSPGYAFKYAFSVVNGPCPELEDVIASSATSAYHYALDVLLGPFPKGEPAMATDSDVAECYARRVLKGRFPAGEAAIMAEPRDLRMYKRMLDEDDPEGLAEFDLEHGDWVPDKVAEAALAQARKTFQGR